MPEDHSKYKDRLFTFIFGSEENKAWTLSLYNAINGSNYTDPDAIRITTIKGIMYLGMGNDIAFLIFEEINLYEHQSSFNPNMPVRLLQYAGNLYEKYMVENKLNKYGSRLLKLPVPKLVVFYNGEKDTEDEVTLKLSDSFPKGSNPDIEVRVRMININYGRNRKLLEACRPLKEYSWLVAEVRKDKEQGGIESAIDKAITDMLTQMGVEVGIEGDEMCIRGLSLAQRRRSGRLLKGGSYTSCDDHRMVMALKVASLGADSPIIIDNETCVEKSFPGFFDSFDQYLSL